MRLESPPPLDQRPSERLPVPPRLDPTKENVGVDSTTTSALPRPRDRKSMVAVTWEGVGRQGGKRGGVETRLELLEATEIGVCDPGAFGESALPVGECVDDAEGDQGVERPRLKAPLRRRHQGRLA